MKFKFLAGDINWKTYGGKFVSKKLNNSQFDYWLVIEVLNWKEREAPATYNVSLKAVSPSEAGKKNIEAACECYGVEEDIEKLNPLVIVEALASYGVAALLWNKDGNNLKVLLKEAHKEADLSSMLFGFYMDRPKNKIGSTGWDFIKGDLLAGLK